MHDPLRPHRHNNNSQAPDDDSRLWLHDKDQQKAIDLTGLQTYPRHRVTYSYTTDHGNRGPFQLEGVRLIDLILAELNHDSWQEVEVLSADGFGNRLERDEIINATEPIMLCFSQDGQILSRQEGLVRLLVPSETDNALRQVKWVRDIRILNAKARTQSLT